MSFQLTDQSECWLKGLAATPDPVVRNTSAEWNNQEIREFVPQSFRQDQYVSLLPTIKKMIRFAWVVELL